MKFAGMILGELARFFTPKNSEWGTTGGGGGGGGGENSTFIYKIKSPQNVPNS